MAEWTFVFKLNFNAGIYGYQSSVLSSQKLLIKAPNDLCTLSMIPLTLGEYADIIWCCDSINFDNSCKTWLSNSLPPSLTDCLKNPKLHIHSSHKALATVIASLFSIGTSSTHLEYASVIVRIYLNFVWDFNGPTKSKCILWFLDFGGSHGCNGTLSLTLFLLFCWWHILHNFMCPSISCAIEGQKYLIAIASYVFVSLQCPPKVDPWWFDMIISRKVRGTHNLFAGSLFVFPEYIYNNPLSESINELAPYNLVMVIM